VLVIFIFVVLGCVCPSSQANRTGQSSGSSLNVSASPTVSSAVANTVTSSPVNSPVSLNSPVSVNTAPANRSEIRSLKSNSNEITVPPAPEKESVSEKPKPEAPPVQTNPGGATARCRDGSFSYSQNRRGTCSHHGGVAEWF
jgi:hypothetical protein